MRGEVIQDFYDLQTGLGCVPENTYHVGDVFEGTAERVRGLVERGFLANPTSDEPEGPAVELGEMTNDELRALAASLGVTAPKRANKAQLVKLVREARGE